MLFSQRAFKQSTHGSLRYSYVAAGVSSWASLGCAVVGWGFGNAAYALLAILALGCAVSRAEDFAVVELGVKLPAYCFAS